MPPASVPQAPRLKVGTTVAPVGQQVQQGLAQTEHSMNLPTMERAGERGCLLSAMRTHSRVRQCVQALCLLGLCWPGQSHLGLW